MGLLQSLKQALGRIAGSKPDRKAAGTFRPELPGNPERVGEVTPAAPEQGSSGLPWKIEDVITGGEIKSEAIGTFTEIKPSLIVASVIKKIEMAVDPHLIPVDGFRVVHGCYDVFIAGFSIDAVRDFFEHIIDHEVAIRDMIQEYMNREKLRATRDGVISLRLQYDPQQDRKRISVVDARRRDHAGTDKTSYKDPKGITSEAFLPVYLLKIPTIKPKALPGVGTVAAPSGGRPQVILTNKNVILAKRELPLGTLLVGRASVCDLQIDHCEVSELQLMITRDEGRLLVEDCDSRNGSYLNLHNTMDLVHLRSGELREIRSGDRIFLNQDRDAEIIISFEGMW